MIVPTSFLIFVNKFKSWAMRRIVWLYIKIKKEPEQAIYIIALFVLIFLIFFTQFFQQIKEVFWEVSINKISIQLLGAIILIATIFKLAFKIEKNTFASIITVLITLVPIFLSNAIQTYERVNNIKIVNISICNAVDNIEKKVFDEKHNIIIASLNIDTPFENFYLLSFQYSQKLAADYLKFTQNITYTNYLSENFNRFGYASQPVPEILLNDLRANINEIQTFCTQELQKM